MNLGNDAVLDRSKFGMAEAITGGGTLATAGSMALLVGVAMNTINTTYSFLIPTKGLKNKLDVVLRPSAVTIGAGGTITLQATRVLIDGVSKKGAAVAGAAPAAGVQQVLSVTLNGEPFVLVEIILSNHAGHTITLDQAEVHGS